MKITPCLCILIAFSSLISGCVLVKEEAFSKTEGDQGNDLSETITINGVNREFLVHLPPDFNKTNKPRLLFVLHGFLADAEFMRSYSNFNRYANERNLVIIYPDSLSANTVGGSGKQWDAYLNANTDDVAFIKGLIEYAKSEFQINDQKIFLTGYSNGGFMTYRLMCEAGSQFAAIATVAGHMPILANQNCPDTKAVPALHLHSTDDPVVPFNGIPQYTLSGPETVATLAEHNQCSPTPSIRKIRDKDLSDNSVAELWVYRECANNANVQFYKFMGSGHSWPGAELYLSELGVINKDIIASEVILDFFDNY